MSYIINLAESTTGYLVKRSRSDRASEYMSNSMNKFYIEKDVIHEPTPAYAPESNGRVERLIRAISEHATTILSELQTRADPKNHTSL